jgi:DNA-nicking Smr family endonuclease
MSSDKPRRYALRQLTDDDRRLWNTIARSITPLRRRPQPDQDEIVLESELKPAKAHPLPKPGPHGRDAPGAPGHNSAGKPVAKKPPGLAPLARRERQRLARGGTPIEARIDLHGLTQSEAHAALARFLRRAQDDGVKFALVITGKGARFADHGGDRGVLRRQVPLWLKLPEFRPYVVGFEDAHTAHGGEGALYVRIRRGPGLPA